MTTLLRQTNTGLFSRGADEWTDDPLRAIDFRFSDRAAHYARAWSLRNVEVAFVDDQNEVIAMPLEQALSRYWRDDEVTGSD